MPLRAPPCREARAGTRPRRPSPARAAPSARWCASARPKSKTRPNSDTTGVSAPILRLRREAAIPTHPNRRGVRLVRGARRAASVRPTASSLAGRSGLNGERVETALERRSERRVHHAVALDAALALKSLGHDIKSEVRLAALSPAG